MLCQQTSPKRWFANVNMTSYRVVTSDVYAVTMTTIRHCSMREFGKGAYNQEVAPGITRPLHATVYMSALVNLLMPLYSLGHRMHRQFAFSCIVWICICFSAYLVS